jgi:hypothetical protein
LYELRIGVATENNGSQQYRGLPCASVDSRPGLRYITGAKSAREQSMVELKMFVADALRQIVEGIAHAQDLTANSNARINPPGVGTQGALLIQMVEFDVAVTVNEDSTKKGGVGVVAGVFGIGAQGQSSTSNQSVSRIKFAVPILFPSK